MFASSKENYEKAIRRFACVERAPGCTIVKPLTFFMVRPLNGSRLLSQCTACVVFWKLWIPPRVCSSLLLKKLRLSYFNNEKARENFFWRRY